MKKVIYVIGIIFVISITIFLLSYGSDKQSYTKNDSFYLKNDSIDLKNVSVDLKNDTAFNVEDFKKVMADFRSGNYSRIIDMPKEYYTQPEFYPTYVDRLKKDPLKNTYGYGATPGEISFNVTEFNATQHLDVYTFVLTSPEVDQYQQLKLILKSPNDYLFETQVDPSDIFISPIRDALKDETKTKNWTYKIKMIVTAKKDIPKGKYVFRLNNMGGGIIQAEKFFDFILYVENR